MGAVRLAGLLALGLCWVLALGLPAHAGIGPVCDGPQTLTAAQKGRLFRLGAIVKAELENSGHRVALIARSGTDLARFGVRYSHAGFSLKASPDTPWAVRQLYFACDEQQPRIFDQGMLGFVLGLDAPALGYVSLVLLPPAAEAEIERAALSNLQALQMLAGQYSANAYPYSLRYQNCNQWVAELMASAWGRLGVEDTGADAGNDAGTAGIAGTGHLLRAQAQSWLKQQGYTPTVFDVGWRPLMWLGAFIPWIHSDDHPPEDLAQNRYRVSMPASIEAFVRATQPGATRLEFCHTERHVVIHRGWAPMADGCVAAEEDTVIALD